MLHGASIHELLAGAGNHSGHPLLMLRIGTGQVEATNRQFHKVFNIPEDHAGLLSLKRVLDAIHPDDRNVVAAELRDFGQKGKVQELEFRLGENESTWIGGEVVGTSDPDLVLLVMRDISLIKEHQRYITKYTAQKDALLDMMVHNLSGPLSLSDELLKVAQGNEDKQKQARIIELLRDNTRTCLEIVTDFLVEEHRQSAQTFVRKGEFSVVEKIRVLLERLQQIYPLKKFMVVGGEHLWVVSDAVKFYQVVHNLLSNAIKYTADDGEVTITIKDNHQYFSVEIADNGCGIPESIQQVLFAQPIKGQPGLRNEVSVGMGLYLIGQLVRMMQGRIGFSSRLNGGSSFRVELPKF